MALSLRTCAQLALLLLTVTTMSVDILGQTLRWLLVVYAGMLALTFALPPYRSRPPALQPAPSSYVLLTGCTGGLGEVAVHQLAAQGWNIVLHGRDLSKLQPLYKQLSTQHPRGRFEVLVQDLSVHDAGVQLLDKLRKAGFAIDLPAADTTTPQGSQSREADPKYIDVLINNAGFGEVALFLSSPLSTHQRMIDCHLSVSTALCHGLLPSMLARGRGRVANVSSMVSYLPSPRSAIYAATKAYLTSFTNSLAFETALQVDALTRRAKRQNFNAAPPNVAVSLVCPGATHTSFASAASIDRSLLFRVPGLAMQCAPVAQCMVQGVLAGQRVIQPGVVAKITPLLVPWLPSKFSHLVDYILWGEGDLQGDFSEKMLLQPLKQ